MPLHHASSSAMGERLYTANLGDSRAVICRNGRAISLTKDHKPNDPKEKKRVEEAGGRVVCSAGCFRVCHDEIPIALACSRSIGDMPLKIPWALVSAEPDIRAFNLSPSDEFVIIASDGLWDVMRPSDAVESARSMLAWNRANNAATRRSARAKRRRSSSSKDEEGKNDDSDTNASNDEDIGSLVSSPGDRRRRQQRRASSSSSGGGGMRTRRESASAEDDRIEEMQQQKQKQRRQEAKRRRLSCEAAARALVKMALSLGSEDNVTCAIVAFHWEGDAQLSI